MIRLRTFFGALALAAQPLALAAQPPSERDWSATLRSDAQALHDDIAANHPGPVNSKDPGFARRNDRQLALALDRARDARSYADYFFALREYVSSFDDAHMGFGAFGDTPNAFRWPGFLTGYDPDGSIRVVLSTRPEVPVGATLLGCDGMSAANYARATLGRMWGRWQLQSQRLRLGRMLFIDEGSRYIPKGRRCRFEVDGRGRPVQLDWRMLAPAERRELMKTVFPPRPQPEFGARTLADGTRWFSIPSFDGDPSSRAGKALPPMIAAMAADRPALAAAPAIVLDLRGNGGGSSDWSRQIAEILWGRPAIRRLPAVDMYVEWRVSKANLAAIEESWRRRSSAPSVPAEVRTWFEDVIAGLAAALARGDTLWRQPDEESSAPPAAPGEAPLPPLRGRVYLLTDSSCGSACLDAVDLWRALGAIQVGQATGADTLYMEIRDATLPSRLAGIDLPMKVYRGRPRGANEPAVPEHAFTGDIADTAALERWIAALGAAPPSGRKGG